MVRRSTPEQLVAIFGPTAVGKTEIAIELARLLQAQGKSPVAVSADAFQVYEGLDVLTAKPDIEQLGEIEHRLLSFVPVDHEFSVAEFSERAHEEIDRLLAEGRRPIVVGGTGLYLRAALAQLDLRPPPEPGLREELERDLVELGLKALHSQLPGEAADAVHPRDRKRIIRTLELERMGQAALPSTNQLWSGDLRRPTVLFGISIERETLAMRISERVDRMLEADVVSEVELAMERGASKTARKTIGFAELEAVLAGQISLDEAGEQIKRRHRQYAKRQITWMRKLAGVEVIDRTGMDARDVAATIGDRLPATVS